MIKVYYTVYHRQSMKTIKDNLDRSGLIYFLYETWYKDIDIVRLIEAVNEEGILRIHRDYDMEW